VAVEKHLDSSTPRSSILWEYYLTTLRHS